MSSTDSFTFCVHDGICSVITHSHLSNEKLKRVLTFIFETYAPVTLIEQSIPVTHSAYTFAQTGEAVDVSKLLRILSRQEMGWHLSEGILFSPRPSQLDSMAVEDAILAARISSSNTVKI